MSGSILVPDHVTDLYKGACDGCTSKRECLVMAQLLRVSHDIPLAAGIVLIQQLTCRLDPKKEKVSRHVRDLVVRDLIEPAHNAWSSAVVLVQKKDGGWRFCVDYCKLNSVTI